MDKFRIWDLDVHHIVKRDPEATSERNMGQSGTECTVAKIKKLRK